MLAIKRLGVFLFALLLVVPLLEAGCSSEPAPTTFDAPPKTGLPEKVPPGTVRLTWYGTAAYRIETARTVILIDPFVTRPGILATLFAKLEPNEGLIARHFPRADGILIGHNHYDHLMDAPSIARRTGATIAGSRTTGNIARGEGVEESQIHEVSGGDSFRIGDFSIRVVESRHGRALFGRVPFPGEVESPPEMPIRARSYRMGGAFGYLLEAEGIRIYHLGSAGLVGRALEGLRADVLILGAAGRKKTPGYAKRVIRKLRPRLLIPSHYDNFTKPLADGVRLLPRVEFDAFIEEVRAADPGIEIVTLRYGEPYEIRRHGKRRATETSAGTR